MVARKNLLALLSSFLLRLFDNLRVVLKNIGESYLRERLFPQIVGLEAQRIGRIACAVIKAFVEWQEPGIVPLQFSAKAHFLVIHGEVGDAAAKLE